MPSLQRNRPTVMDLAQGGPREGEVLVQLYATARARSDLTTGLNAAPRADARLLNGAGVVRLAGASVTHRRVGDRVFGRFATLGPESLGSYVSAPQWSTLALMPLTADFDWAARAVAPGIAALALIDAVQPRVGERTLVAARDDSLALVLIQLLRRRGVHVIAPGAQEHQATMRALGVATILDPTLGDFNAAVRARYPGGIDVAIDAGAGSQAASARAGLLRAGGRMATMGSVASVNGRMRSRINAVRAVPRVSSASLRELARVSDQAALCLTLPSSGTAARRA